MEITGKFLRNHFKYAHEALGSNFYIEFRFIKEMKVKSIFCKYKEISLVLPKVLVINKNGWQSYFGVNPRPVNKCKKEKDIEYVVCLFVDIDVGERKYYSSKSDALRAIQEFSLNPSCIVSSGNGYHIYWLLNAVVKIKTEEDRLKVKSLLSGLIKTLHADPSGCSLERVLRLPGTLNHKNNKICQVVEDK